MDEIKTLLDEADPALRIQKASAAMDDHRRAMSRLATLRAQALLELRRNGHSAAEIARMLGVTRQQVHRILREALGRDYRPEDRTD